MSNWFTRTFLPGSAHGRETGDSGRARQLGQELKEAQDEAAQKRVLDLLVENGTETAQRLLLEALHDPAFSKIQGLIIYRLSHLDIDLARPALLQCLRDQEFFIRGVAADAIGDMDVRDSVLTGTLVSLVWLGCGSSSVSLANSPKPGLYTGPEVLAVLNSPAGQDRFVLNGAIKALGKLAEPAAVEPLQLLVSSPGVHPDVSYNAEQALLAIGQPDHNTS